MGELLELRGEPLLLTLGYSFGAPFPFQDFAATDYATCSSINPGSITFFGYASGTTQNDLFSSLGPEVKGAGAVPVLAFPLRRANNMAFVTDGTSNTILMSFTLLLSVAFGCSPSGPTPISTKGTVKTKSGRPCDNALVVFHPLEQGRLNDPKPLGKTDSNGHFSLTTFAENDGALPGEYAITVVWPGQDAKSRKLSVTGEGGSVGADQLKGKFGNPSKPLLKATIPNKGAMDLAFEVD